MPYIVVENFKAGLDRTGSRLAGRPGSVFTGENVVLNRKGEIVRRKKFVTKYSLPSGTFWLHVSGSTRYVFGSGVDPGVPAGVTYQRLQHPDGSTAMTAVLDSENFDGKPGVAAQFADGGIYYFYDGALVTDWYAGTARDDMTNNDGIAEHLKALIDASTDYGATRTGSVVTVTGAANTAFTVATTTEDGGGTDDQTLVATTTQQAVADVTEIVATGVLTVTGGAAATPATGSVELTGGASGSVDGITVNGVQIMSGAEAFDSDLDTTAANVAANITAHTSSPNYTATAVGAVITITAAVAAGAGPNTFAVVSSTSTITTTDTNMSGGANKGVSSVTVDGVEVLGAQVNYTTSNSILAAAIASQINTYSSSPEYTASASGNVVTISAAAGTGSGPNGFVVAAAVDTGVTVDTANMADGVDAVTGQPQITTLTVGGTFQAGDKFNAKLGDTNFGYIGKPSARARNLLTFKGKMYATTGGSLAEFSGVNSGTVWDNTSAAAPGANFINAAAQDEGSQELTGLGVFQGTLALFARNIVQTWQVDADESLNAVLNTVKNTGTRSPQSILAYGNRDLYYLHDSGIRSLRARDSSNAPFVDDVGTPIDPLVQETVSALTDARVEAACAAIEPLDGRYFLAVGSTVFVFNYFPGNNVSAWTTWDTTDDIGADIVTFATEGQALYARAGNTIYEYGGAAGDTYPDAGEVVATVLLPYLDGDKPAHEKTLSGFDTAASGEWRVRFYIEPADTAAYIEIGRVTKPTYGLEIHEGREVATHVAVEMVADKAGAATITNMCIHYTTAEDED